MGILVPRRAATNRSTREAEVKSIVYVDSDIWLVGAKQYNFTLQQGLEFVV